MNPPWDDTYEGSGTKLCLVAGIRPIIEDLVEGCVHCQQKRDSPAPAPLNPWIWPTELWQRIHVDFGMKEHIFEVGQL